MTTRQDLTGTRAIWRGRTYVFRVSITEDGAPADLTNATARARFAQSRDGRAELELTLGSGLVRDGSEFVGTLTPVQAQELRAKFWQFDVIRGGHVEPIHWGTVDFEPGIRSSS
ncbi:hypothetical protein DAETH_29110 [Deinococcus aetherius]|uniref:Uncharacterized protein n=1 Tax=Deinococcus aetherius TaxID=200252 RepID=A0ABN6RHV2_9DEIO|nr:hypothetical protein [Deinococcus aetherius]BDP42942.1 hypothetical protein DAETH_29110 [Deinococcus aetherius]